MVFDSCEDPIYKMNFVRRAVVFVPSTFWYCNADVFRSKRQPRNSLLLHCCSFQAWQSSFTIPPHATWICASIALLIVQFQSLSALCSAVYISSLFLAGFCVLIVLVFVVVAKLRVHRSQIFTLLLSKDKTFP